MALAPGGRIRPEIRRPVWLDAWDQRNASRCFVTLLNSMQWMAVTGEPAKSAKQMTDGREAADWPETGLEGKPRVHRLGTRLRSGREAGF